MSILVYGGILFLLACIAPPDQQDRAPSISSEPAVITDTSLNNTVTSSTVTGTADAPADPAKTERNRVRNILRAKAEQDWPNDYSTQEYWINQEMDDYQVMLGIPNNRIKRQAERDWPYDFSTQKYWYEQQIAARERLNDE